MTSQEPRYWHGVLLAENADFVTNLILKTLENKFFTFVKIFPDKINWTEVQTSRQLKFDGKDGKAIYVNKHDDFVFVSICYDDALLTLKSNSKKEIDNTNFKNSYILIKDGQVRIIHKVNSEQIICWIFAVEEIN